jgi:ribonuclease HI
LHHQQLWRTLIALRNIHAVRWKWVKGHNGHPVQTEADALASGASRMRSIVNEKE